MQEREKEPKIETSDNTFKIILPIGYHEKNGLRDSRLLARCVYIIMLFVIFI